MPFDVLEFKTVVVYHFSCKSYGLTMSVKYLVCFYTRFTLLLKPSLIWMNLILYSLVNYQIRKN